MKVTVNSLFKQSVVQSIVLLAVAAGAAHAANWNTCSGNNIRWNNGWTNMAISTTSFAPGSSRDADIQDAMWHWNNVKGSSFNYYYLRGTSGTHLMGNGVNEMYFDGSEASGSTLAVTHINSHCYWFFGWNYGLDETDIAFNTNAGWTTDPMNYNNLGSPYGFEDVALHELGHALGLNHENRWMATMNAIYPNSGPLGYYEEEDPNADDRVGARILYPDGTTEVDVAGSAFKETGSNAGTSTTISSPYYAARGSYVNVDCTFSNLSTSSQTFDIGFYLSSDSYIDIYDTLLGMNYGAWGSSGTSFTFTRSLYIPTSVAPGTYYLGFLIDPNNALADVNRGNNNQPMTHTVYVY